jgi:hypothetical protein
MVSIKNKPPPKRRGLSTKEAIEVCRQWGVSVSTPTMIKWIQDYNIGTKIFGKWYVNKRKLLWYLKYGDKK